MGKCLQERAAVASRPKSLFDSLFCFRPVSALFPPECVAIIIEACLVTDLHQTTRSLIASSNGRGDTIKRGNALEPATNNLGGLLSMDLYQQKLIITTYHDNLVEVRC
ncbi:hypothetical protein J3458_009200 [Metarhizium acridum]|uniref:uncharacterized protein n=1 Tax=Metarhizium acridum TaxID=92637 RepID=UPI001C6D1FDE|nr:hypothetical protein J3458_009200 [Metarhizium acridum]